VLYSHFRSIADGIDGKSLNGPDGDRKKKFKKRNFRENKIRPPFFIFYTPCSPAAVNIVGLADDVMQAVRTSLTPPTYRTHNTCIHSYTLLKHAVYRAVLQK
jgi:hypothetical protein